MASAPACAGAEGLTPRKPLACDAVGRAIPGLYVCGNDMQSAFGGEYPGAGGQLGQAMTFGWIRGASRRLRYPAWAG